MADEKLEGALKDIPESIGIVHLAYDKEKKVVRFQTIHLEPKDVLIVLIDAVKRVALEMENPKGREKSRIEVVPAGNVDLLKQTMNGKLN